MPQETATIRFNRPVKNGYHKIGLTCHPSYRTALPGQFVTLKIAGRMDPLLRRPFSIHRVLKDGEHVFGIEILYRVVGGFTRQLSEMSENETIDLLGPLGHGFTHPAADETPVLAAGGIGVAPMVFLAESLDEGGIDISGAPVFLGGKTAGDVLCETDFSDLGMVLHVTTEKGDYGEKGLATAPLANYLEKSRPDVRRPDIVYACGPHGFLRAVADLAEKHALRCEVSIETVMACGLGVCMGCAVQTRDLSRGYRHICKDGPVFDASVVIF